MKKSQMLQMMSIDPNVQRTDDVLLFLIENKDKVSFYLSEGLRRYDSLQVGVMRDRVSYEKAQSVRLVYALNVMRDILVHLGGFSIEESEIEVDVLEKLGYSVRAYLN